MLFRVWFDDLEKAIAAVRSKTSDELFCAIRGNAYGDFVFEIDEGITYIVKHGDFSVWRNDGGWRYPNWQEVR